MLAAAQRWGGGEGERPFLGRAISVMRTGEDGVVEFLLEDVGPGTKRLCELDAGDGLLIVGPFGRGFSAAAAGRRCSSAAASASRRWSPSRRRGAARRCSASATRITRAPRRSSRDPAIATDDGSAGHHGFVTELLDARARRAPRGRSTRAARRRCWPRSSTAFGATRRPSELALEAPMACGFGACYGCVVATVDGYRRACLDGPVFDARDARVIEFCGLELRHPVINGSGCFDALAARRVFGEALLERFPFAAYVSKTITLAPREGNPPPRLWEAAAGLINSIGLPNRGLAGYLEHDLPALARLPVPLITNVMGSTAEEVGAARRGARPARARSPRSSSTSPARTSRPASTSAPTRAELEALLRHVRPLTREAADRQADAEHRRRRRLRGRRRRRAAPTPCR